MLMLTTKIVLLCYLCTLTTACIHISSPTENYTTNTALIQQALDSASKHGEGDGCVRISRGDYPVKRLQVNSNTQLILEQDVKLINVINVTLISIVQVGPNANNVTIEGGGTLYGNAENGWKSWSAYDDRMSPYFDDGTSPRTHCLYIINSNDVRVGKGLKLHNATDWTFRMDNSSNIVVDDVDIYGDSRFPNNVGFDPQSCVNVSLTNSRIDVADDGICPKADINMGPLKNLYVHNVTIRSKSHAIKFGSNTDTLMSNIVFDNITIVDSNGGLSIQQRTQGDIVNVTWSNIHMETRYQAARWWGNGEWLSITSNPRNSPNVGTVKNMRFVNITGRSENGGLLSGLTGSGVENIEFENVHIRIAAWSNYSDGPQPCCADEQVCVGKVCIAHPLPTGKNIPCMGTRDYRPTANGAGSKCPKGHDRVPAKADGIFLENAHGISFKGGVVFEFEMPRKKWFGTCVNVDKWSTNITGLDGVTCIHG